jgi:hypothetical protein
VADADKRGKTIGGKILKWIGIVTAVISFVLGARQVVVLIQENLAEKKKAAELRTEAERLSAAGEYSRAWETISQAVAIRPELRDNQAEIAMQWLRDARINPNHGERTFTEISDKLLPVLFMSIDSTRKPMSATIYAHIGWAYFLRFREGDWGVKVEDQFRHALQLDSTNLYANAMYGFWLLYPERGEISVSDANRHFEEALNGGGDTSFVRHLAIAAFTNASTLACEAQLIRLADQMRRNHEVLEPETRQRIVSGAYYLYRREIMDEVGRLLSPQDHLDTFEYLTAGMDLKEEPYLQDALASLKHADGSPP